MVTVKAGKDFYDSATGGITVPKDSVGIIKNTQNPPADLLFYVDFSVGLSIVSLWVNPEDLTYLDGSLDKVRAVFEGNNEILTSLSYPYFISETDIVIDDQLHKYRGKLKLKFMSGLTIFIEMDRNRGELKYGIGYEEA